MSRILTLMKSLFNFSDVAILLTSSVNFPSKEKFAKNSNNKVTVTLKNNQVILHNQIHKALLTSELMVLLTLHLL